MGQHHDQKHHHHHKDVIKARCFVLTVSDSRNLETDGSGNVVAEILSGAGHNVSARGLVPDDIPAIRGAVLNAAESGQHDVVIATGGTGIGPRDVTPEAVEPLVTRSLPGFGEAFRAISFREVGPVGLLSRATAGVVQHTLVFAIPGSPAACRTALEELIVPMIPHAVAMIGSH